MMVYVVAAALPVAGVWVLTFMALFALVLLPVFPFILRHRRKVAQKELHKKIEEAKEKILEDGVVEGPKGPRARHIAWGSKRRSLTDGNSTPKHNAYHGGPWR
jgi:hypothetical protein